jgi:hypothetical protein
MNVIDEFIKNKIEIETSDPDVNRALIRKYAKEIKAKLDNYKIRKAFLEENSIYIITQDSKAMEFIIETDVQGYFVIHEYDVTRHLYKDVIIKDILRYSGEICVIVKGMIKDILALNAPICIAAIGQLAINITKHNELLKAMQSRSIEYGSERYRLTETEKKLLTENGFWIYNDGMIYKGNRVRVDEHSIVIVLDNKTVRISREKNFESKLKKAIIELNIGGTI